MLTTNTVVPRHLTKRGDEGHLHMEGIQRTNQDLRLQGVTSSVLRDPTLEGQQHAIDPQSLYMILRMYLRCLERAEGTIVQC